MRGAVLAITMLFWVSGDAVRFPRPPHTDHAKLARWLVHSNTWGSLATTAADGTPSVGVVSFSDGPPNDPSGRLFFYLTPMDETTQHLQNVSPSCSLSISEAQLGATTCKDTDEEDPTCARISVIGTMQQLAEGPDTEAAAGALFSRHPAMKDWPQDHGFLFFELQVKEIHMLSWYGGMAIISADDYYAADLNPPSVPIQLEMTHPQQQQRSKQPKMLIDHGKSNAVQLSR